MRLFIGIPLPTAVTAELAAATSSLRTKYSDLRWTPANAWHITVQFLGNADQEQYNSVAARLGELRFRAIPIRIDSLGFFDRAGVFFAGVLLAPELAKFQQLVNSATAYCGFELETQPYHPHITLARSKGKEGKQQLRALHRSIHRQPNFGQFVAGEFLLYESLITPMGSQYEARERFAFQ